MDEPYASRKVGVPAAVRAELARAGVKQVEIAGMLGIAQASISRRLNGHQEFSASELETISRRLGVPVAVFFGEGVSA